MKSNFYYFFKNLLIMKKYLLVLSLVLLCSSVFSQVTLVSGEITSDEIWQDTIKVIGDVSIADNTTLSINQGTVIEFDGYFKLSVQGKILAVGSESDSILFTVVDTVGFYNYTEPTGGWNGIEFINTPTSNDSSKFVFCKFEFSKGIYDNNIYEQRGLFKFINFSKVLISNSKIINCYATAQHEAGGAIYCRFSSPIIKDNYFENNGICFYYNFSSVIACDTGAFPLIEKNIIYKNICTGIYVSDDYFGGVKIYNNFIANNSSIGIYESSPYIEIVNNIIVNNGSDGVFCGHEHAYGKYVNNTICFNGENGLQLYSSHLTVQNNIIYGNMFEEIDGYHVHAKYNLIQGGYIMDTVTTIDANPEFINPSNGAGVDYDAMQADFSLLDSSPAINKGNPDTTGLLLTQLDYIGNSRIFGNRIDIGAIENQVVVRIEENDNTKISLYPNPFNDILTIISENEINKILIYSVIGKKIGEFEMYNKYSNLNLDYLPQGVYFINVYTANSKIEFKVIKE